VTPDESAYDKSSKHKAQGPWKRLFRNKLEWSRWVGDVQDEAVLSALVPTSFELFSNRRSARVSSTLKDKFIPTQVFQVMPASHQNETARAKRRL
jgi:hypothetical protein